MKLPTLREVGTEAKLLLIGIPVFIWTMVPIYHMFLFAISPKEDAFSGKLWPTHPTLNNFYIVFHQQHYFLRDFWIQFLNSVVIALSAGALTLMIATAAAFSISRLQRARRALGDESRAAHLFHPGGVPRRADVPHHGHLRPAQQSLVADSGDGDDRVALRDLGAEAGLRQAAGRARRGRHHGRRHHAATVSPGVFAVDDALAGRDRHLRDPAGLERISLRLPAACPRTPRSRFPWRSATSWPPTTRRGNC